MNSHHRGAVLAISCLAFVVLAQKVSMSPLTLDPNATAIFLRHSSDGTYLTQDELKDVLSNEFQQVQNVNDELLKELLGFTDQDGDGQLNQQEFVKLAGFLTKNRVQNK